MGSLASQEVEDERVHARVIFLMEEVSRAGDDFGAEAAREERAHALTAASAA